MRISHLPSVASTIFHFTVPSLLANAGGNLHGGAVALIFDTCTSMTCTAVSREGFWDAGHVSRSLNCQYLRPAPVGTTVVVESWLVQMGRNLGTMRAEMRLPDELKDGILEKGKVCYTCVHDKVQVTQGRL
jgi:acyl-coenzyme A thioesterase 13